MIALFVLMMPSNPALARPPRTKSVPTISYADYPQAALARRETGIVSFRLHVDATGRATSCAVTETSGSAALDQGSCKLYAKRAQFDPATDTAGTAVDGDYFAALAWGIGDGQPRASFDIPLAVATLPPGYAQPVKVQLTFGQDGRARSCEVRTSSGSSAADVAACTYLAQQFVISPPRSGSSDEQAVAVRYVTASLNLAKLSGQ